MHCLLMHCNNQKCVWVVAKLPQRLKSTLFEIFSHYADPFVTAQFEKISKNVDFSLWGKQCIVLPKWTFFSFQLIVLFYPGECYEKFFPSPQWLRTRTSNAYLVRIVKIIKMSMQKKKYAQEIHEPRWRRKKREIYIIILSI